MIRILGVDPGSSATGWAVVSAQGNRYALDDAGVIRPRETVRSLALAFIDRELDEIVRRTNPDEAAVETPFSGVNPRSGLKLAECRGVVLAVLGRHDLEVHEYSPALVKRSIVGTGRAEKQQVVFMVERLLHLERRPAVDAADAMAIALTHLHGFAWKSRLS